MANMNETLRRVERVQRQLRAVARKYNAADQRGDYPQREWYGAEWRSLRQRLASLVTR